GGRGRRVTCSRMRKTGPVLVFLMIVSAAGFVLAGVGATPAVGVVLGILAVGAAGLSRVSTDRIVWVTACIFVVTVTWNGIRVGGGAFGNVFLALAVVSLVAHVIMSGKPLALPPWLLIVGLGVLLAQLLSLVFPPNVELTNMSDVQFLTLYTNAMPSPVYLPHRSDVAQLLKFEVSIVLVPVLMLAAGVTRRRCTQLLDLFTISALVNGFVAVADYSGFQIGPTPLSGTRASGLTIHPNYLALTATIAIPLAMLWLARADVRWRLAGMFAVPTLVVSVYASGSRAGAVTAVMAVALTAVALPRLRRSLAVVLPVLGMLGVVVLVFTSTGDHILSQVRISGGGDTAGSDYQRSYVASVAIEQIKARPLQGVGFSVIADAHDIYLELLAAGGAIVLASFFLFCGGLVAATTRGLRGLLRNEVTAAAIAVGLWLVNGILDNQVADKYLYVVPGVLIAMGRVSARAPVEGVTEATPGAVDDVSSALPSEPSARAPVPA
ncbi:MAG: hypothetical protein JWO02_4237, partial [Solirubrobacterales bacterium]|nr:hypothetical protein [Solirubrobacterales bacterium]